MVDVRELALFELRRREDLRRYKVECEEDLGSFIRFMWKVVEPSTELCWGWPVDLICDILTSITDGHSNRDIINVCPGFMKSFCVNVFWPAWEWIHWPHLRYLSFSYASSLTERDNGRFSALINSDLYRALWGQSFLLTKDNSIKVENNKTGWKIASSVGGTGTGERANRIVIDDANNIKDVESRVTRDEINRWYMEVLPSRVIDPNESVFINIQQRSNEDDVSGLILSRDMGYEHICLPMEFDPERKCYTSIGWEDWRQTEGELLWPEVYDQAVVDRLKSDKEMSSYSYAGQYQQSPSPRGGGIIKASDWRL